MELDTDSPLAGLPETLIRTTYLSLTALLTNYPVAFADLVAQARDERHTWDGDTARVLGCYGLLDLTGSIRPAVQAIALASTNDEGPQLRLLAATDVFEISPPAGPATPNLMSDQQKTALIAQCLKVASIFDEEFPDTALESRGYRDGGVNPFYNRTTSGLYLEYFYGAPNKIWTPWGEWSFVGSTGLIFGDEEQKRISSFMARLTSELHIPLQQSEFGGFGPVYTLHAVEGVELPPPGEVIPRVPNDEYRAAKEEWARLGGPDSTYNAS